MSPALTAALTVVLLIAAAIWIGGYFTVAIVSIVSARTLNPQQRVQFFQAFGKAYLRLAGGALIVVYAIGWTLLARTDWTGEHTRMLVASIALLLILGAGVAQARNLTRRRARLTLEPQNTELAAAIRRRAYAATALRSLIGIISLGLLVQVAVLLVGIN